MTNHLLDDLKNDLYAELANTKRSIDKYVIGNGGKVIDNRIQYDANGHIIGMTEGQSYSVKKRLQLLSTILDYIEETTAYIDDATTEKNQAYQAGYRAALQRKEIPAHAHDWRQDYRATDIMKNKFICQQTARRILAGDEPTTVGFTLAQNPMYREAIKHTIQKENTRKITIDTAKKKHNF